MLVFCRLSHIDLNFIKFLCFNLFMLWWTCFLHHFFEELLFGPLYLILLTPILSKYMHRRSWLWRLCKGTHLSRLKTLGGHEIELFKRQVVWISVLIFEPYATFVCSRSLNHVWGHDGKTLSFFVISSSRLDLVKYRMRLQLCKINICWFFEQNTFRRLLHLKWLVNKNNKIN